MYFKKSLESFNYSMRSNDLDERSMIKDSAIYINRVDGLDIGSATRVAMDISIVVKRCIYIDILTYLKGKPIYREKGAYLKSMLKQFIKKDKEVEGDVSLSSMSVDYDNGETIYGDYIDMYRQLKYKSDTLISKWGEISSFLKNVGEKYLELEDKTMLNLVTYYTAYFLL